MVSLINDCHVHIGKQSMINQELSIEGLINFRTDFQYLDKVLVMGTEVEPNNELIYEWVHKYNYLYGLHWWINGQNIVRLDDKMIGIKYHGKYNNAPVTSLNPRHLQRLDELKAVLLVHCGRYLEGDIKSNTSYLHALAVAHHYPKIKVILAHMGGTDTTVCMKAIEHGTKYHNVYFDTSGITTPFIIEYALDRLPSTRILFGSDIPWCSFNAMIWTVSDAMVNLESKKDIFTNNFEMLLK